jgi:hypothetical protein
VLQLLAGTSVDAFCCVLISPMADGIVSGCLLADCSIRCALLAQWEYNGAMQTSDTRHLLGEYNMVRDWSKSADNA